MEAHNTKPFHGLKPFGWLALLMAAGIVHANDNGIPTSSANPEVTAASESVATLHLCTPSVARSNAPADPSLTTLYKPHITYLGPSASFRKDELTGKSAWEEGHPFSIKRWWDLPESISLTVEERVRYESYATPWMKGNTQGQYGIPIQSVAWFKAKPTDDVRFEVQFWDARQYGSPDPNKLNTTMVNVLNLEQVFTAWINRDIGGSGLDLETKVGQMQMAIGSNRLIGIVPFKSTQFQYVGIQNRLRSEIDDFEWITFANTPEQMLPSTTSALAQNAWVWNRPITDAVFAGTFLDKSLRPHEHLELYFYYLHEGPAQDLSPTLYTPGLRVFKEPQKGSYDYEIETIGQSGWQRVTSNAPLLSVGSIMQHLQAGHTFDAPWTPRFLLQWDYASSHFNSLFPSTVSEYGPDGILALFSRNNINTPGYRLFLNPNEDLTFYAANRFWWLADPRSTSGWSNANLVDLSGKAGSFVGQTWELNGRWDAHENLALQVGWQILMKGNFARYAPGAPTDQNNVNYWYVQTLVRF
jgi:Alginate export